MPAIIVPPQGVVYPGSTLPRQALLPWTQPPEGAKTVPLNVLWTTDAGPNLSLNINLQSTQVSSISQIVGLYVDNIQCQAPVTFYFPDTQFKLEVPPLSFGWYPVITTAIQFVMYAPLAVDQDQTLVQVLNYWLDPATVSNFAFADNPAGSIAVGTALNFFTEQLNSEILIPANTEGIVTGFQIDGHSVLLTEATPAGTIAGVDLSDVGHNVIYWATGLYGVGYYAHLPLAALTGLNIEMTNGLQLNVNNTSTLASGFATSTIFWRRPS